MIIISFLYAQELRRMTSELQILNTKLDYKASHDQLTGRKHSYITSNN